MGDITAHFSHKEFRSKDGQQTPIDLVKNIVDLAINLERLRIKLDVPIRITSGYRSPEHNDAVGGAARSQHLLGKAADIQCNGLDPVYVYAVIEEMIEKGSMDQGGLGLYTEFVHYDIRGYKSRW